MQLLETVRSTLSAYSADDVRSMLHNDHDEIRELTNQLINAERSSSRKSIIKKLKPLLTAHSRAEEDAVYKSLMTLEASIDSRLAGNEGMVEHNLADIVLGRLAGTPDASTDMWRAHAKVLHELLEHHIKEEEDDVFKTSESTFRMNNVRRWALNSCPAEARC
jgi:hypothetical protein